MSDTPSQPRSAPHNGDRLGDSRRRVEDARLVTGKGRFTDDVVLEGALRVAFVRSAYAHGCLAAVDTLEAEGMPGVAAVFTGPDVQDLGCLAVNPLFEGIKCPPFPVIACGRVRAVGQPVAAILADTAPRAADAAEWVSVDITPEPAALTLDPSEDAPALFAEIENNQAISTSWRTGDAASAFERTAHVVSARIEHARVSPAPLEPRTAAADYDAENDRLTIWMSTQTPHRARNELARILHREQGSIRVIATDVGGAFGMKGSLFPEEVFVAWAAIKLARPVRWTATRSEEFLSATHGRGATNEGRLALDDEGRFLALEARIACPLGHWLPFSAAVPPYNAGRILPGPYAIDTVDIEARAFVTTTTAVGIYRGAGRPEAAALMERLVNEAAAATRIDPLELRRRNLVPPQEMPHRSPTGITLDSGDYPATLDRLAELSGYDALRADCERRRANGEIVGIGLAFYVEPSGVGWETAEVRWEPDGTITGITGSSAQGQGRETAFAQILAEVFDVPADIVTIRHGDTSLIADGIGALASRSTPIGGSALYEAACKVRDRLRQTPECADTISESVVYTADGEAWGYGCHLAVLAIDPETGTPTIETLICVDDAGTLINPMLAEGQVRGGIAQGFGEAMMERIVYDGDGQLVTGSFMDYAMPRASDLPPVTVAKTQTPSTVNLIGAKGIGEAGTIGAPAAILNAAYDALRPLGVDRIDMPLTPDKLWTAIAATRTTGTS
ncbi:MAG: xanthine dehydrogenase [Hyphomicrobiales bacterium]|nr:MAG: xanthine dehydrogenase [Hyphomicrobiales bacterium]